MRSTSCRPLYAIATRVDQDSVEPLIEARLVSQSVPAPPRLNECVVRRVLRLGRVVQDGARQPVGGVEVLVGQSLKCRRSN